VSGVAYFGYKMSKSVVFVRLPQLMEAWQAAQHVLLGLFGALWQRVALQVVLGKTLCHQFTFPFAKLVFPLAGCRPAK
jgi:hypothetical protein